MQCWILSYNWYIVYKNYIFTIFYSDKAKSTSEHTQITSSNATIYYKIFLNNVVMLYIGAPKNLPTATQTQLATLPSSIVPKNIVYHDTL